MNPKSGQYLGRVMARSIGEDDFSTRQSAQGLNQPDIAFHERAQFSHPMRRLQETPRFDLMLLNQAEEGCAIAQPVFPPECIGAGAVDLEFLRDEGGHTLINAGDDPGDRVVERVIQIEEPDRIQSGIRAIRTPLPGSVTSDHGPDALTGEDLEKHAMINPAVDNMDRMHPRPRGIECRRDFGQHPSRDRSVRKEFVDAF